MALKLYHDIACTQEITDINPDEVKEAVSSGSDLTDETIIYLKSDNALLTYENITIEQHEDVWVDATEYAVGESVEGSDENNYMCIQAHTSATGTKPVTGTWAAHWVLVNDVDIDYATDDGEGDPNTYADPLALADGVYGSATPIHRKAFSENITAAFRKTNISHKVTADEYIIE